MIPNFDLRRFSSDICRNENAPDYLEKKIYGFHWDLELIFASKDALNLHPCETNQLECEKKMTYLKTTFVVKWLMFVTCHMSASFLGV